MARFDSLKRKASLVLATAIGALTLSTAARAVTTVTTPNASLIGYSLNPGQNSGAIYPPAYQPVLVMGTCYTLGYRGVGHVSMLRIPSSFLEWVGLNSPYAATIASGFSGSPGTRIVGIDWAGQVTLQVNNTDSFRVNNAASAARAGYVTMIW